MFWKHIILTMIHPDDLETLKTKVALQTYTHILTEYHPDAMQMHKHKGGKKVIEQFGINSHKLLDLLKHG